MSYINKRYKLFEEKPKYGLIPVRSEARIKSYSSATDARAWSDIVEERRQHILEYNALNKAGCLDKLIPLEILFEAMMANKNLQARKLRNRIQYLQKKLDVYDQLGLTCDQRKALKKMRKQLDKKYQEMPPVEGQPPEETQYDRKRKSDEFPATKPKKRDRKSGREDAKSKSTGRKRRSPPTSGSSGEEVPREKPQRRKRRTDLKAGMDAKPSTSRSEEAGRGRRETEIERDRGKGGEPRGSKERTGKGTRRPTGPGEIPDEEDDTMSAKKRGTGAAVGPKPKGGAGGKLGTGPEGADDEGDAKPEKKRGVHEDVGTKPRGAARGRPGPGPGDEKRDAELERRKGVKPRGAVGGRPGDSADEEGATKPSKKKGAEATGAGGKPGEITDEYDDAKPGRKKAAAAGVAAKPRGAAGGRGAGPESADEQRDAEPGRKKGADARDKPRATGGRPGESTDEGDTQLGKKKGAARPGAKPRDGVEGRARGGPEGRALPAKSADEDSDTQPVGKKGAGTGVRDKPRGAAGGTAPGKIDGEGGDAILTRKKAVGAGVGASPKSAAGGRPGAGAGGKASAGEGEDEESDGKPGGKKGTAAGVGAKSKGAVGGRPSPKDRAIAGEGEDEEGDGKLVEKKGAAARVGAKPKSAAVTRPGTGPEGRALAAESGDEEGDGKPVEKKGAAAGVRPKPKGAAGGRPAAGPEGRALAGEGEDEERDGKPVAKKGAAAGVGTEPKALTAGKPAGGPEGRALAGEGEDEEGGGKLGGKGGAAGGVGAKPRGATEGRPGVGVGQEGRPEGEIPDAVGGRKGAGAAFGGKPKGAPGGKPGRDPKDFEEEERSMKPRRGKGVGAGPGGEARDGGTGGRPEGAGLAAENVVEERDAESGKKKAAGPGVGIGADGGRPKGKAVPGAIGGGVEAKDVEPSEGQAEGTYEEGVGKGAGASVDAKPKVAAGGPSAGGPKGRGLPREGADEEGDIKARKGPGAEPKAAAGAGGTPGGGTEAGAAKKAGVPGKAGPGYQLGAKDGGKPTGTPREKEGTTSPDEDDGLQRLPGGTKAADGKKGKGEAVGKKPISKGDGTPGGAPKDVKEDKERADLEKRIVSEKHPRERERLTKVISPTDEQLPSGGPGDETKRTTAVKPVKEKAKKDQEDKPVADIPSDIKGDKVKEKAYPEKKMAAEIDPAERERLKKQLEKVKREQSQEPAGDIPEDIKGDKAKEKAYLGKKMAAEKDAAEKERSRKQLEKVEPEQAQEPAGDIPEDIKGDKAKEKAYLEKKMAAEKAPAERERLKKELEKAQEPAGDIPDDIKEDKIKERAYLEKKEAEEQDPKKREELKRQLEQTVPPGGEAIHVPDDIRGDKQKEKEYLERLSEVKDPTEREKLRKQLEKEKRISLMTPEERLSKVDDPKERARIKEESLKDKVKALPTVPEDIKLEKDKGISLKPPGDETKDEKQRGILLTTPEKKARKIISDIPDDTRGDKAKEKAYLEKMLAEVEDPAERQRLQKQLDEKLAEDILEEMPDDIKGDKEKERAYLESKPTEIKEPAERERLRKLLDKMKRISLEVPDEKMEELLSEIPEEIRGDKEKERGFLESKLAYISDSAEREHLKEQLDKQRMKDILGEIPYDIEGDKEKEKAFIESKLPEISDPLERRRLKEQLDWQPVKDILAEMPDELRGNKSKEIAYLKSKLAEIKDPVERDRIRRLLEEEEGLPIEVSDDKMEELLSEIPDSIKGDKDKKRAFLESKLAEIKDPHERERLRKLLEAETGLSLEPLPVPLEELLAQIPDEIMGDKEKEAAFLESKLADIQDPIQRAILKQHLAKQLMKDILDDMPDDIKGDREKERAYLESKLAEIKDPIERERMRKLLEKEKGMSLEVMDDKLRDLLDSIPDDIKGEPKKKMEYLESKLAEIQDLAEREMLKQQLQRLKDEEKLEELVSEIPGEIKGDKQMERAFLESKLAEIEDPAEKDRLRRLLDKETLNDIFADMPDAVKGDKAKEKAYLESMLANIKDPAERARLLKLLEEEMGIYLDVPDEKFQKLLASIPDDIKGDKEKERALLESKLAEIEEPVERERMRKQLDKERLKDLLAEIPDAIRGDREKERTFLESMLAQIEDPAEKERLRQLLDEKRMKDILSDIPDCIKEDPEKERAFLERKLAEIKDPMERERLRKILEMQRGISLESPDAKLQKLLAELPDDIKGDKAKERAWLESQVAGIKDPAEKARLMKLFETIEPGRKKPCRAICMGGVPKLTPEELLQSILSGMPYDIRGDLEKERAYFESVLSEIIDPEERDRLRKLFDESDATRKIPCKGVCGMGAESRPTPEELLQNILSEMPPEIRGDREKERAYFENALAVIADPVEQAKLRKLFNERPTPEEILQSTLLGMPPEIRGDREKEAAYFENILAGITDPYDEAKLRKLLDESRPGRKIPCPGVCGMGAEPRQTPEDFLQSVLSNMPNEIKGDREKERAYFDNILAGIADPVEKANLRKLFDERPTPEDLLQSILLEMPFEIKGDREKERTYFESVLAGIADPMEKAYLTKLFDAKGFEGKPPCPGVCGIGAERRPTPEDMPDQTRRVREKGHPDFEHVQKETAGLVEKERLKLGERSTPEDLLQSIMSAMPNEIRGDEEKERAYLESVLAGIADPMEKSQLKKIFDAQELESRKPCPGICGVGTEKRPTSEDLLQNILSDMPTEVRGDKEKERDYFESFLSRIASPVEKEQLRKLCDAKELESKQPCPGVCGMGSELNPTPEYLQKILSDMPSEMRGDIKKERAYFENVQAGTTVPFYQRPMLEDLLQNILSDMPNDIRGDREKERAYFESVISEISDPVENAQLQKLFDKKWLSSGPCSSTADQKQTPEERAYFESIITEIVYQVERESQSKKIDVQSKPGIQAPCKAICADEDTVADRQKSLRKTSGVVALRDSMPGPSGTKSLRPICGATIKVEDRCAALIRQAQQRSAALAASSGGVVILPKSSTRSPGDLVPRGYLPGAALPEVIPPTYAQTVPSWLQQSNELDQTRRASYSQYPTSQPVYLESKTVPSEQHVTSETEKHLSKCIETEDMIERKAKATETQDVVEDIETNAIGTETDRVILKDAEDGTGTERPELEVSWKKENYEASSVSDFENVICKTVSATDLNIDFKELAKRGLKICKAECVSCDTTPKPIKTEEAVGSFSVDIRSQGVQSERSAEKSSSESYASVIESTSGMPDAAGEQMTSMHEPITGSTHSPEPSPSADEPTDRSIDELTASPIDEAEPEDQPPSSLVDEPKQPLKGEPEDEPSSSMVDQPRQPLDEELNVEVFEQPSIEVPTASLVEEHMPEEAEEKSQEEQEIFEDTEDTVLEEKLISDDSEVEEHDTKEDSQMYETADSDETDSVGPKKESEDKSVHFEEVGTGILANTLVEEVEEKLDEQIIPTREEGLSKEQIPRIVDMDADQTITDVPLLSETRIETAIQETSTQVGTSETISTPIQTTTYHPRAEGSRLMTSFELPSQRRRRVISIPSEVDIVHEKPIEQVHKTVITDGPIKHHVETDTNVGVIQLTDQGPDDDNVPKKFVCRAPCSKKGMFGKLVERICQGPCAISPTPGPSDYKAPKPKSPCRAPCAAEAIQTSAVCTASCAAESIQTSAVCTPSCAGASIQTQSICKAPCATQTLACPSVSQACQSPIRFGVSEVVQTYQPESSIYTDATDASCVTDSVADSLPDDASKISETTCAEVSLTSMGAYPVSCGCQADLSEKTSTPYKVSRTCQASCSHISRGNQMVVFKGQSSKVFSSSCQASCAPAERSTSPTAETSTYTTPHVCGARGTSPRSNTPRGQSQVAHVCTAHSVSPPAQGQTSHVCAARNATRPAEGQTANVSAAHGSPLPNSSCTCAANLSRERKASRSPTSSRQHVCKASTTEDGGTQRKLYPIKDNVIYRVTMPDPLKPLQEASSGKSPRKDDSEEKDVFRELRKDKRNIRRKTCTCDCWKKSGKEECRCMERRYRDPNDSSKYIVGCNCKDCSCGCRYGGSNEDKDQPPDDNSRKKHRCQAMKSEQEDLSILMIHKDAEIIALRNALRAKESYCAEQRKIAAAAIEQLENIKSIVEERDDLRKKLETSQSELEELKKNVALGRPFGLELQNEEKMYVPFLDESTSDSPVREEEILQLEEEISNMRSGNLTPELEAKVIRKEVEVLKRYCSKLSVIQKESSHLKVELAKYKDQMAKLGLCGDTTEINDLRYKLSSLNDTIKERNDLKQRVKHLEKQLSQYSDLPEDVEVFKQRSQLLDEVLQDRDRLSRRVEQLRGLEDEVYNLRKKAARVDELEENLTMSDKQNKILEDELEHVRCKCSYAEIDALNSKAEGDTLRSKLVCMEHETETLKSQNKDRERLKQERDHLKNSLDELTRMQGDFEHMKHQMKSLEVLKAERDMFKSKYENLIGLECECDILRSQVERAKVIEKERDTLESQVEDLEICISDQENEIRRLVCHIDALAQKDNQQEKLKGQIASMREEMDTKSALLLASEEKLATMQCQFKTSFEDIRTETSQLRLQKEHLDKEIDMLKRRNKFLEQELCCLKSANDLLVSKMEDYEDYIEKLQRALKENDTRAQRSILTERCHKNDAISTMRYELEAAKEENDRLQQTIQQMNSKVGDEHLQQLLSQSRIAIERIALELNKQYQEWDCLKGKLVSERKQTTCSAIGTDDAIQAPTGWDTNKQTKAVGIGEKDSNLWDCNRKAGDADSKPDGGAPVDPSQWDCKQKAADEEGIPCDDPCARPLGADPRLWDCKQRAADGGGKPCNAPCAESPGADPSLWDCKRNAIAAPCGAPCAQDVAFATPSGFGGPGAGGGPLGPPACNCLDGTSPGKTPGKKGDPNAPCTCLSSGEKDKKRNTGECNCLKYFQTELKQPPKCNCLKHFGEASDDPSKWECKDKNKIKELEARIALLEEELAQANDTILELQERLGAADRASAENLALRKHSVEVQDMAKDQIEELVEHLKKAKARVAELEDENGKFKKSLDDCLEEKKQLLARIKELQDVDKESMKVELESLKKEKDDMDTVIASTIVTASRRCSKLETEFDEISAHNKQLQSEMSKLQSANQALESDNKNLAAKLASLTNDNQRLNDELNAARTELENLRKLAADPNLLEALRKENEDLKRQINELLEQLKKPAPEMRIDTDREMQETDALKAIIADLENQLKNLKKGDVGIAPSDELEKMIKELTRKLEEEQRRADAAEKVLQNLKASDPSALFNDEIKKLKERVAQLEAENADLRNALAKANSDVSNLQKELSSAKDEVNKMRSENSALKEAVTKAQADGSAAAAASAGGDEIERLKARIAQLENENNALKNDLNKSNGDNKNMYDTINKLQNENSELKQSLAKLQNDNDKMKKDMDNMFNNAQKESDKVLQLEKENEKLLQTIKNLEAQIDKLKKDLDATLNQAKRESTGVSELQDHLAKLKQKIAQLEGDNSKLKADLSSAMDNYKNAAAKLASYTDENEKLKGLLSDANKDIAGLKKENQGLKAIGHEKCAADLARAENEIANLQKKIAQLEGENVRLKGELNTALDNLKKADDADLRQKLMMLENENSKLKSNLDAALKSGDGVGKLRENIVKLEADNVKLSKDLSTAMDSLNKSNATISQLNNEIDKLKEKIRMLEAENAKLKQDLNKALDDMKRVVAEAAQARDDEAKLKQRIAQMEAENTNLKKDLDKAMADAKALQQMREENEKLKNRVNALERTNADLKKFLDESKKGAPVDDSNKLKEQIKMLENELNKLKDDHKKCPSLISQLNDEINNLKKKLSNLEKENVNLKTKYDGAAGDFKSTAAELASLKDNESKIKQQISQLQDENKKLNAEITALRAELKAGAGDIAALKDKEAKLNQRLSQLENENAKLKRDLDSALDQLKKAEKACDQVKDENAALKQRIAQLEAENALLKKNLDSAVAEAKKAGVKEDDSKLRERLAQLEAENKKLKSDLNIALDEARKSMADLSKARDDDNKMKQRLANLENENARLKKELEKTLAEAQTGSSATQQLKDENNKMKQKIVQLESEIDRLKKELNKALEDAKKGVSGISAMQDDDAKLKQRLAQLERENAKMRSELEAALKDASGSSDMAAQLRGENAKQKNRMAQLEDELKRLRKELENSLSDAKKGASEVGSLQDEIAKLKQRIAELEKENAKLKSDAGAKDENNKLRQRISLLEGELDKLRKALQGAQEAERKAKADLSKMKEEEQKLKQKLTELESSNSKLKQDLDSAVGKSKAGIGDIEKTKDENAKMKQAMAQQEIENAKLKKELDNALNNLKSTSSELQRLKDENAQLKQKIAQLEASNADMKKKLDSSLDDSKKSTGQVQDLLSEIQELKQSLAGRDKQLEQIRKEMEKAGGEAKDKTVQLSQIMNENAKLKQRIKDLENQLQKCQDSLKTAEAEAGKNASELAKIKELNSGLEKQVDRMKGDGEKSDEYATKMKSMQDTINSMKEQFDRDMKNLLKKNEESIAKLQHQHDVALRKLNEKHDKEVAALKDEIKRLKEELEKVTADRDRLKQLLSKPQQQNEAALKELNEKHDKEVAALKDEIKRLKEELERVTADRDRLKQLLEDQKRRSIDIKSKVELVEGVIVNERRKSKEERRKNKQLEDQLNETERALRNVDAKYSEMKQRSADLEEKLNKEQRKSKELEKERQKEVDVNLQLQIEKEDLRRGSLILQNQYDEEKRRGQTLEKQLGTIRVRKSSRDTGQWTMQTFETANFPDVIAISAPLSDKEMKYFGKEKCSCKTSLPVLLEKMMRNGIDSLELEELQFIHMKISDATAELLQKFGQASGVLRPNENDKLSLMRRIAALEEDLKQKQKHAQLKVKSEKQRLAELRKNLDDEKHKNFELLTRMGMTSKSVSEKQKLAKMEHYLDIIDEEKTKAQRMKEELVRERTNAEKLRELLKAGQSKPSKRDSDGSETLRARSLTGELMLKMKGQEKPKRRSSSPISAKRRSSSPSSLVPVKDVGHSVPAGSRTKNVSPAFYTDIKPGAGHCTCISRKTFSSKSSKSKDDAYH